MPRTLLLGLDSMTFTVLDALLQDGRLPFLRRCMEEGVRAELLSTPNPLTPPAWTTLMTGVGPGVHGVYDFMRFTERADGPFGLLTSSHDVLCETIWSLASRQDRRVISLNFPAMFPVKPIDGFVVPGYVSARQLRTSVFPRDLYPRLKALPGFDPREFSWNMEETRKAVEGVPHEEYERWIRYLITKDQHWFQIAHLLMSEEPWDLSAIVFDGVDRLQHLCWRFFDPEADPRSDWDRRIHELAIDYFVRLDEHLARLVKLAGPGTRVFLASDHGAGSTTEIFYANAWLASKGYLAWKKGTEIDRDDRLSAPHIFEFYRTIDWRRTRAYVRSSSANGIYIRRRSQVGEGGVPDAEYASFRAKLVEELLNFRDPQSNEPVIRRVMVREEAFPGPAMEDAPDITLFLRDGGHPSILPSEDLLKPRSEIIGMHRLEGVFLALGPGIRRGENLSQKEIADVAPTLLYSLGLPIPSNFEGKLIEAAFEPAHLEAEPPRVGPPAGREAAPAGAGTRESGERDGMTQEDEAKVIERLRHLGYLD
jgi:predicted AlkP superfamily phosphohydrolase/phosphomutase